MWARLLDRMLGTIFQQGRLTVRWPDGRETAYGDGQGVSTGISLNDPAIIKPLVLHPELSIGEAYMDGAMTIDGDDLRSFFKLAIINMSAGRRHWMMQASRRVNEPSRWLAQHNPIGRAQHNVAHHYDLSGELYDLFLDEDRQYSCAYFRGPSVSLEQAQADKKAHIAKKLGLEPGMKVLDIGCGWGGMGLTLARDFGAKVLGVTLSREQHAVAMRRAREAGLEDRLEFRLCDYRHVHGSFDRIVSVGMFEHVGALHYREYFRHLRKFLTPGGVALVHTIGRATPPGSTNPWIRKYIFPGGYIPAMSEVLRAVENEGLWVTDVEVWRLHYAETLKHWYDRFCARIDEAQALYDARFCRMWRYYLAGSEMIFRHDHQSVFQFQLARDPQAVPLTRDYLYDRKTV